MDADALIRQVDKCRKDNWQNSDLWTESEQMLEKIADHFRVCAECRADFDAMGYPESTLTEFENRIANTQLRGWVCDPPSPAAKVAVISRKAFREDRKREYYSCEILGCRTEKARIFYVYSPPDSFTPVEYNGFAITGPRREGQKSIEIRGERINLEWVE